MVKRGALKYLILALSAIVIILFYYMWQKPPYKITNENVKAMYCTYWDKDGENKIEVKDSDKAKIISEISRMKRSGIEGQVGTIPYNFTIELIDGSVFHFYQNSSKTVTLQKGEFYRNIKAPNTAEFIKSFLSEHNIKV